MFCNVTRRFQKIHLENKNKELPFNDYCYEVVCILSCFDQILEQFYTVLNVVTTEK